MSPSLGGARLRLEWGDHVSSPERGAAETEALVARGASVVLGAWHSAVTMSASAAADRLATPFLNAESLGDEITERGSASRLPPGAVEPHLRAGHMRVPRGRGDAQRGATGHRGDPLRGLVVRPVAGGRALRQEAEARGIRVAAYVDYPKPPLDLDRAVAPLIQARPDVVLQASYVKDAVEIRRALARGRLRPKALVGHITLFGPRGEDFVGGLPATGEHSLWTLGWWSDVRLPGVDVNGVCDRFERRVGFAMDGNGALELHGGLGGPRGARARREPGPGPDPPSVHARSTSRSESRGTSGTTRSASARTDRTCTRGPSWSRSSAGGCAPCGPSSVGSAVPVFPAPSDDA